MDDRESIPATLANTFGINIRLKLTWEECDFEPNRSDHVKYRVEVLSWATNMMNSAGNTYEDAEAHEILKRVYYKVKQGEVVPSLADETRAGLKKYIQWVEDTVSEFYGGKPPSRTPNSER